MASTDAPGSKRELTRHMVAGGVGNFVEWYDFGIYGFLSFALAKNFFTGDGVGPMLATFAVFGVSFVCRPIGAVVFGHLGDRIGRKGVLSIVVLTIAIATGLVAFLPTYEQVGWLAPFLLVLLRCVQGFAAGGEYGGASSFVFEHAPKHLRGMFGGILGVSTYLAYLAGASLAFGLSAGLSEEAMMAWGWRIPFFIAIPLGIIGLYIRTHVQDTPEFEEIRDETPPTLQQTVSAQWKNILLLFGFIISNAVGPYLLVTYIPTYLKTSGRLTDGETLIAQAAALILVCILLPVFGWLSDRVGRRAVMVVSTIMYVVVPVPAFTLIQSSEGFAVFIGLALLAIAQAASTSVTAVLICELFPTAMRVGSSSIAYNLAYALFGGTAPFIATWLVAQTGVDIAPAFYVIAVAAASTIFVFLLPETSPKHGRRKSDTPVATG